MNDRFVTVTGHPTDLLRYLPLNGRFSPDLPFTNRMANDKIAAYLAVPMMLPVFPNKNRSLGPDTTSVNGMLEAIFVAADKAD